MKKCGLVIRVSTQEQAMNKEGSLTNQPQMLRDHLQHMTRIGGEPWVEVKLYILRGISGKDSLRSKEFAPILEDIKTGTINTLCCTALDRVSRSVKDFLNFFEFLNKHNVEFVCLKQSYDTTSSQGRLLTNIAISLAQFEREQTSERNRDTSLARAERGLWNGGYLLGYDLDPDKKVYLIPNPDERVAVNFAFDKCLELGSAVGAMKALNSQGFRTKEYTSRRGKRHSAKKFSYMSTFQLLTNRAYIGKKEINKKKRVLDQEKLPESQQYRTVDARWEGIVDGEKFWKVQELLKKNSKSRHNSAKAVKHNYIVNGVLFCAKCGSEMQGRPGNGARGVKYYYYVCKSKECRFAMPAGEVEQVVLERIKELSGRSDILEGIVKRTNERMKTELPQLRERKDTLERELVNIKATATGIIRDREKIGGEKGEVFVRETLEELGDRRKGVETGIQEVEQAIGEIERESVSHRDVMHALSEFGEVFGQIPPYQQKDLVKLVVNRVELASDSMKMALYGRVAAVGPVSGGVRTGIQEWLRG
ncbi:MAG: recombinase family protein [Candidatus Eisenbacteria bacterium]|nr:recombinase family protein [Candidatus Eisenbacteria bacterium]